MAMRIIKAFLLGFDGFQQFALNFISINSNTTGSIVKLNSVQMIFWRKRVLSTNLGAEELTFNSLRTKQTSR